MQLIKDKLDFDTIGQCDRDLWLRVENLYTESQISMLHGVLFFIRDSVNVELFKKNV